MCWISWRRLLLPKLPQPWLPQLPRVPSPPRQLPLHPQAAGPTYLLSLYQGSQEHRWVLLTLFLTHTYTPHPLFCGRANTQQLNDRSSSSIWLESKPWRDGQKVILSVEQKTPGTFLSSSKYVSSQTTSKSSWCYHKNEEEAQLADIRPTPLHFTLAQFCWH